MMTTPTPPTSMATAARAAQASEPSRHLKNNEEPRLRCPPSLSRSPLRHRVPIVGDFQLETDSKLLRGHPACAEALAESA